MFNPPHPIQSCRENDQFSLIEQGSPAHDGRSSAPRAVCRPLNFEWGPGVHEKFASSSSNYFNIKIALRSIWDSFSKINTSNAKFTNFSNVHRFLSFPPLKTTTSERTTDDNIEWGPGGSGFTAARLRLFLCLENAVMVQVQ